MNQQNETPQNSKNAGIMWLLISNLLWGGAFVAWYYTYEFAVNDALALRILTAAILGVVVVGCSLKWDVIKSAFTAHHFMITFVLSLLLLVNWYAFVASAQEGLAFETAFAYFAVGIVISALSHITHFTKPTPLHYLSYALCALALVQFYAIGDMQSNQLAFIIMASWAGYMTVKKTFTTTMPPLLAFTFEIILLTPFAIVWLLEDSVTDISLLTHESLYWLASACVVFSFLPLWMLFRGQKTAGLFPEKALKILSPVVVFITGWFYLEQEISQDMMIIFGLIWASVAVYLWQESKTS